MRRHKVTIGTWSNRPGKLVVSWRDIKGVRRTREFPADADGEFEADKFKVEVMAQLRTGSDGPDDRMTFGTLADAWLRGIKDAIRRPTYKYYGSMLRTHLKPAWGDRPAISIRAPQVMELASEMLDDETGPGLSKGTVAGMVAIVKAMYNWANLVQYAHHDPTTGVAKALRLGKRPKSRRPLNEDEIGRFMKVAPDVAPNHLLHFHTLMETGVRLGECLGIMDVDIDPERLTISIRQQVYDDGSLPPPKSEQGIRSVRVSAAYMALVMRAYADRRASGLISPWLLQPEFSLPEPTQAQSLRARRMLHAAVKRVARAANLPPGLSPHWLRHTYGSDRIAHGEDIARVSQGLGHSRISTTLNLYVEAIPKPSSTAADEAAERRKRAAENADMTKVSKFRVRRVAETSP